MSFDRDERTEQATARHLEDLAKKGPNHLEQEIASRVAAAPQRWTMVVTVAEPGDVTADPSKAWPAGRRTVEVGTLVVKRVEVPGKSLRFVRCTGVAAVVR